MFLIMCQLHAFIDVLDHGKLHVTSFTNMI